MVTSVVLERKKEIVKFLTLIESYSSSGLFKHEMMTYAYVLVCGSIEFMTESILEEWLKKTIQRHDNSQKYRGKKYIQDFLSVQLSDKNDQIESFTSTKLSKIKELIGHIAGDSSKNKFNSLLSPASLQQDANARLDRISRFRHELAHGQKLPQDTQPNVTELKEDFLFVYKHIILNIKNSLPRV
jgi:hypothetical protein